MSVPRKNLYRVIDANFNRVKEGLRVCEDISRYVLDHKKLTADYKALRHDVTEAVQGLNILKLIEARNIQEDVGRGSIEAELKRTKVSDLFYANSQRVKESLRVLEEFAKLLDIKVALMLKKARYESYALEQKALKTI